MEWCVDSRVPAASAAAESEICSHLARHAASSATVESARPVVRDALQRPPQGPMWLTLDWEDEQPCLEVFRLPDGPLPGIQLVPGVSLAHDCSSEWIDRLRALDPLSVRLPVSRPFEGDLDPHPRSTGGLIGDLPVSIAGVIADEVAAGRTVEEAAARAGATMAEQVAGDRDVGADPAALAELIIETEHRLGGDFHLIHTEGSRAVLGNRQCPFGPSARPSLCRFTSALAGGLAARAAGAAEITLDERLALHDRRCRLVVDLGPGTDRLTSHRYSSPPAGFPSTDTDEHRAVTRGFRVTLSLQLPRDRLTVPVTRHLIGTAMREVGVLVDDIDAVELAVTEACANVIDHSGPGDVYEVSVTVGPDTCHMRVIDLGHGFDHSALIPTMAGANAEHGRGVALMHALVDMVRFESQPESGTIVHLVKKLRFDDSIPARRLMLESIDHDQN